MRDDTESNARILSDRCSVALGRRGVVSKAAFLRPGTCALRQFVALTCRRNDFGERLESAQQCLLRAIELFEGAAVE